jgi:hypothetical protein
VRSGNTESTGGSRGRTARKRSFRSSTCCLKRCQTGLCPPMPQPLQAAEGSVSEQCFSIIHFVTWSACVLKDRPRGTVGSTKDKRRYCRLSCVRLVCHRNLWRGGKWESGEFCSLEKFGVSSLEIVYQTATLFIPSPAAIATSTRDMVLLPAYPNRYPISPHFQKCAVYMCCAGVCKFITCPYLHSSPVHVVSRPT